MAARKRLFGLSILMVLLAASTISAEPEKHSYKPENGYVQDETTAAKIAEAVLSSIYGQETIDEEKPLKAGLKDAVWTVEGTLNCPEGQRCLGGVAVVEISKDDGKILRVSHGE